jgi:hypothetical protein
MHQEFTSVRAHNESGNDFPKPAQDQLPSRRDTGMDYFFHDFTSARGSFGISDGLMEELATSSL